MFKSAEILFNFFFASKHRKKFKNFSKLRIDIKFFFEHNKQACMVPSGLGNVCHGFP